MNTKARAVLFVKAMDFGLNKICCFKNMVVIQMYIV